MKKFAFLTFLYLLTSCAADKGNVIVGGLCESKYVEQTAQTIADEGLGSYNVLFRKGPWNPAMLEKVVKVCRENGMTFMMDEVMDRRHRGPQPMYKDSLSQIVEYLKANADVVAGTNVLSEFCGVNFAWPYSSVSKATEAMPSVKTYSEADAWIRNRVKDQTAIADSIGLPRPFVSIIPAPAAYAHLLRSGIDRVDVEMVFGE